MTDMIAELRRLHDAASHCPLEPAVGNFGSLDEMVAYFSDVVSQRPEHLFLHVVQSVDSVDDGGDGLIAITGNGFKSLAHARLFVAMLEALPRLLDAIDTLRWYADERNYHDPTDVPDHLYRDSGDVLLIRGGGGQRARAALAALKRSGAS